MIDITPIHMETVKRILAKHVPDCEVRAFGSRVTWTAKDYSDLDLAVVGVRVLDSDTLRRLKEAFEESDLPFRVDVLDWRAISNNFRKVIEKNFEVIQSSAKKRQGMAGEWRDCFLEELAAPIRNALVGGPFGSDLVSADYSSTGAPVIRGENLSAGRWVAGDFVFVPAAKAAQLSANTAGALDIVFTQRGANHYRQVAVVPADASRRFVISQSQMKLTVDREKADPLFVYYLFCCPLQQEYLQRNAIHTGVPHTNLSILRKVPVRIPSLPTQRAIAYILGTLDDKIELNRRMNEMLEAMARALFKSWFVDFDPVRAKGEGRNPGIPKPLANLFPTAFVDSELGKIPQGWEVGCLGDVAEHPRRGMQPDQIDPDTPYIALEHMPKRCIALSEWGTAEGLESNKFEFRTGEILFGKLRPYFHKVGVAPVNGVCSTDIVVAVPSADDWFGFVLCYMSSVAFVEYTNAGSTGTKMPRTSWSDMARYSMVIPPKAIAKAFTKQVRPAIDRIVAGIHESRTLAALRDALLPKLISGELRIHDRRQTHEALR